MAVTKSKKFLKRQTRFGYIKQNLKLPALAKITDALSGFSGHYQTNYFMLYLLRPLSVSKPTLWLPHPVDLEFADFEKDWELQPTPQPVFPGSIFDHWHYYEYEFNREDWLTGYVLLFDGWEPNTIHSLTIIRNKWVAHYREFEEDEEAPIFSWWLLSYAMTEGKPSYLSHVWHESLNLLFWSKEMLSPLNPSQISLNQLLPHSSLSTTYLLLPLPSYTYRIPKPKPEPKPEPGPYEILTLEAWRAKRKADALAAAAAAAAAAEAARLQSIEEANNPKIILDDEITWWTYPDELWEASDEMWHYYFPEKIRNAFGKKQWCTYDANELTVKRKPVEEEDWTPGTMHEVKTPDSTFLLILRLLLRRPF